MTSEWLSDEKGKAISVRGVPVRGRFINAYAMKTVVIKFYDHHFTAGRGMHGEEQHSLGREERDASLRACRTRASPDCRVSQIVPVENDSSSALSPDLCSAVTLSSAPESSDICLSIFCRRSSCRAGRALKVITGRKTRCVKTNHG